MRKPLSILLLCLAILGISATSAIAGITDDPYLGVGGEQQGNLPGGSTPNDQGGQGAGPNGVAGDEGGAVPLQDGQPLPSPDTVAVAERGESGADLPLTGLQIALLVLASLALVSAGLAVRWMSPGRTA
jgi:hypothetical protein